MRLPHIIMCMMFMPLAACATVDLADMTPSAREAAKPAPKNVVVRTSKALMSKFDNKGWSDSAGKDRMKKAASFLLKGLKSGDEAADTSYAAYVNDIVIVRQDIAAAAKDIDQVVKAADVYLALAERQDDLRAELKALEKTLVTGHQAQIIFSKALKNVSSSDPVQDEIVIADAIKRLRDVTNVYGDRVRANTVSVFEGAS